MNARDSAGDVRDWLSRARDDLRWAAYSLEGGYWPQACFGCQQAAEKSLKAFLLSRGWRLERTHSLPDLLAASTDYEPDLDRFGRSAVILDIYYAATRYPDVPLSVSYTEKQAQDALTRATELVSEIARLIEAGEES